MKCGTCKWWDNTHKRIQYAPEVRGIEKPGFCRKKMPGAYTATNDSKEHFAIGIQPITDAEDRCGEYREKE